MIITNIALKVNCIKILKGLSHFLKQNIEPVRLDLQDALSGIPVAKEAGMIRVCPGSFLP